jgi:hypothetical protein
MSTVYLLWWITIGLALALTIAAASYLAAVVRLCGQIAELAARTAPAAEGIARHTSAIAGLQGVIDLAPRLLGTAGQIDHHADNIASTLESVAGGRS